MCCKSLPFYKKVWYTFPTEKKYEKNCLKEGKNGGVYEVQEL